MFSNNGNKRTDIIRKLIKAWVRSAIISALPFIIIIILGMVAYFHIFEFKGTEKRYNDKYLNETEIGEDGVTKITTKEMMNQLNKDIVDFYKYHAAISYYQIDPKTYEKYQEGKIDKEDVKLLTIDDEGAVEDFYDREKHIKLNENMLYTLDLRLYKKWKYPEQLTQPVFFDLDKLELEDLTDEDGHVIAKSKKRNVRTGKEIKGKEIDSIRDYGLGTVLKYEEGKRNLTVEGTYVMEDYWAGKQKGVQQRPIKQDFVVQLEGFQEQDIHVIEKAITFGGEVEYIYEDQKAFFGNLRTGESSKEGEPVTKYHYATHTEKNCSGSGENRKCSETEYKLYKYRSPDSAIIEEAPRVVDTIVEDKGHDYLNDYIWNFESYVPNYVLNDFDIKDRINYDSSAFDIETIIDEDYGLGVGRSIDSNKFLKVYQNKELREAVMKWGDHFNVDPYIILAITTQESGGDPNIDPRGAFQIDSSLVNKEIVAENKYGELESHKVSSEERKDIDKSAKYAVMRFKASLEEYGGDPYKAIQSYNMGGTAMNYIKKVSGAAWDNGLSWLIFREAGRQEWANSIGKGHRTSASLNCMNFPGTEGVVPKVGNLLGDSCYIENVLQYYAGNHIDELDDSSLWDKIKEFGNDIFDSIKTGFQEFIKGPPVNEEGNVIYKFGLKNYTPLHRGDEPKVISKIITTFEDSVLYSDAEEYQTVKHHLNLFDDNFLGALSLEGSLVNINDILGWEPDENGYVPPLDSTNVRISSGYGKRVRPTPTSSDQHLALDLAVPTGTPLFAVADGVAKHVGNYGGGGKTVKIRHHDGSESIYMHMDSYAIRAGQEVKQGQPIGKSGNTGVSTGAHLHFAFHVNGVPVNPYPIVFPNGGGGGVFEKQKGYSSKHIQMYGMNNVKF